MSTQNKSHLLGTFFSLYIAQAVPMSFFSTALQVLMREQAFSLTTISLLQLIKVPWILKFLWSPLVDRQCMSVKDYKRWIISSEVVYAVLILGAGLLNLETNIQLIIVLVFLSLIASATQDIATDALAILCTHKEQKSFVNGMQSMGSFGGSLLGSGVLLIVLHHYGWNLVTQCLSVFVLLAILPLILNKKIALIRPKEKSQRAKWTDFIWFFNQRTVYPQIIFLLLYYASIMGLLSVVRPYMVDLGYNMKEIGVLNGIVGISAAMVVSYPASMLIRRFGIERVKILFAVFILIATVYFTMISFSSPTKPWLIAGIMFLWMCYGMGTVVVYTSSMFIVRQGREGTDFTIQIVITHISGLLMALISGNIADRLGYHGLFCIEAVIAAVSLLYVIVLFKRSKRSSLPLKNEDTL
ncbi:MFS transporter [Hoylesella timonensis]|uniref:MFS transporter n=1 Tax=Hoylesella timonensis TaxID=386414 RepID=UPI001897EF6B|nr:MFS transporter [Hoylesella timonensis]